MFDYESYKANPIEDREKELADILNWANFSLLVASEDWITEANEAVKELNAMKVDYPVIEGSLRYDARHDDEPVYDEGEAEWEDYDDIVDDLVSWFDDSAAEDPNSGLIFGELKQWYEDINNAFDWPQDQIDALDIDQSTPFETAAKIENIVETYKKTHVPIISDKVKEIRALVIQNRSTKTTNEGENMDDVNTLDSLSDADKSIAQDIAERIVSVATRTVQELNQATASNATNVIKRGLIALKDLENECASDSGMLPEDTSTIASQTDDISNVALRRFHADIRSWDAYAVQREDAKLAFSKVATYWNKIVNIYKSDESSRRKTAAKSYGVPNYRYKVGQMVKVGNRFGKVVGVSREGGTGKQLYEVRIDGKDQTRKCGLKEISSADSKKKVTKSISIKGDYSPEKAKSILSDFSTLLDDNLLDIEAYVKDIKTHLAKAGMDNMDYAAEQLDHLVEMWDNEIIYDMKGGLPNYYDDLCAACDALDLTQNGLDSLISLNTHLFVLYDEVLDTFNSQARLMPEEDRDPRWAITMYKGQATPNELETDVANLKKWWDTYKASAASKSIRSQIRPYKFQPSVGKYNLAGSFDDSYELVDDPMDVDETLESIGSEGLYDFLLVKGSGGDVGEIWGGEGDYDEFSEMTRLN